MRNCFCSGTTIKMRAHGYAVGVLDLTRGEAASSSTVSERVRETEAANAILRLAYRHNLQLSDSHLQDGPDTRRLIVVEGETGFIAGPDDFDVLAQRVIQVCPDEDLRRRLGRNGRRRAIENFNHDRIVEQHLNCCRAVLRREKDTVNV